MGLMRASRVERSADAARSFAWAASLSSSETGRSLWLVAGSAIDRPLQDDECALAGGDQRFPQRWLVPSRLNQGGAGCGSIDVGHTEDDGRHVALLDPVGCHAECGCHLVRIAEPVAHSSSGV